jgi:hypothetical protein
MTDVLVLLRAFNVPLIMVTTFCVAVRINDYWASLSRGRRMVYGGVVLFIANGAVASAIRYVRHSPVDIFTAFTTVIVLLILTGVWLSRQDPKQPPTA